jgi:hypothetical protein
VNEYENPKPHLIPIPPPANVDADRADISKPYPIEICGRWFAVVFL